MTNEDQTQEHLMRCTKILQQNPLIDNNGVMYSDIFDGVDKQSRIVKFYMEVLSTKNILDDMNAGGSTV